MLDKLKQKAILWLISGLGEDTWRRKFVIHKILVWMEEARYMKSWKTTVCGLLAAAGTYLISVKEPAWLSLVGQFLAAVGTAGIGMFARDNDKTSEDAGAK